MILSAKHDPGSIEKMQIFLEEALKLIHINSISAFGNEEIANFVTALLQDRGLKVLVQHVYHSHDTLSKRQFNVVGILGDVLVDRKTRKGVLLVSHLDTAKPGISENWCTSGGRPFDLTVNQGRLIGLGSASAKLDFLCKLIAVEKFREKKLRQPIYLVGTCAAESGLMGAKYLIKSMMVNPQAVLVGDATGLAVVNCQKSFELFHVKIGFQLVQKDARGFNRGVVLHLFGRSTHCATPQFGVNAIREGFDFLVEAMQQGFELRFTRLHADGCIQQIPDHVCFEFFLNAHQFEDFKIFFHEHFKSHYEEGRVKVEFSPSYEHGARFLTEDVFSCLLESAAYAESLQQSFNNLQSAWRSSIQLVDIKQQNTTLELSFSAHFIEGANSEDIFQKFAANIQQLSLNYPKLNVSLIRQKIAPYFEMPTNHILFSYAKNALEESGVDFEVCSKSSASEAAVFFHAGYPTICFGPGNPENNSHGPEEYCLLEECEKAILFYEKMIQHLCL